MSIISDYLFKGNSRFHCALYSLKHGGNPDYVSKAMGKDPLVFRCRSFGDRNPDKNLYFIEMGDPNDGFFAEYGKLLKFLHYANRFHMVPVVKFTESFLYAEKNPVNGSQNPFEYYYEQPGNISVEDALNSRNVFFAEYIHTQEEGIISRKSGDYQVTADYVRRMAELDHKYIRFNYSVRSYLNEELELLRRSHGAFGDWGLGERTIGIHFRGTDYKRNLDLHPVFHGVEEYIFLADKLLESGDYRNVYLATDDKEAVAAFQDHFGDKVMFFNDTVRSSGNCSVAFSEGKRKNHHYRLGLEVIRDMFTLTECGALIAGTSQVSLAARITKLSRGGSYRKIIIINHGINHNQNDCDAYYRKVRKDS